MFNPAMALAEPLDVTIDAAASATASIASGGRIPVGVVIPSDWTTADLTIQTSWDGVTFYDIYDTVGLEFTISTTPGALCVIDYPNLYGIGTYLKLRSGTAATPVAQSSTRTLKLVGARPIVK